MTPPVQNIQWQCRWLGCGDRLQLMCLASQGFQERPMPDCARVLLPSFLSCYLSPFGTWLSFLLGVGCSRRHRRQLSQPAYVCMCACV